MSESLDTIEVDDEQSNQPILSCFAYLLECGDGTLYAGWTTNLEKRLKTHNAGVGAKYTRARLPVVLAKSWAFETKEEAMRFEAKLKRLSRRQKLALLHA